MAWQLATPGEPRPPSATSAPASQTSAPPQLVSSQSSPARGSPHPHPPPSPDSTSDAGQCHNSPWSVSFLGPRARDLLADTLVTPRKGDRPTHPITPRVLVFPPLPLGEDGVSVQAAASAGTMAHSPLFSWWLLPRVGPCVPR